MELNVDQRIIDSCSSLAAMVAEELVRELSSLSTPGVERAWARLLGISGANKEGIPWANILVDRIADAGLMRFGVVRIVATELIRSDLTIDQFIERLKLNTIDFGSINVDESSDDVAQKCLLEARKSITAGKSVRESFKGNFPNNRTPLLYVIVATGNIREDLLQAEFAARQGADVIAVIRATAQSLLDYVPEGEMPGGFGGTFATQTNFRLMRKHLDNLSLELGRYISLTNYASGLCMAEMAVLGSFEGLDMMLADSFYGILFRNIEPERTLIDQQFARQVFAISGIIINTGEDNYLTTADSYEEAHTVLASQFLNKHLAKKAGLDETKMGLGNAFEMSPNQENGLLLQMADALLSRRCFPNALLKYMPPTRWISGDIFEAHVINAMFNLASIATEQSIHLVGILTEGVHTPFAHDRLLALNNAKYVFHAARHFATEFSLLPGGLIYKRANAVLSSAESLLSEIRLQGVFGALASGTFAGIAKTRGEGVGAGSCFEKNYLYCEPVWLVKEEKK